MKYSKFNESDMIGWTPGIFDYSPTKDFGMYVGGMYKAEQYKSNIGMLQWKSQVFQSKIAHALFKANTSI